MLPLNDLIAQAKARRTSDVHICPGLPVRFRIDGDLENMDEHILTPEETLAYAKEMLPNTDLNGAGEWDLAITFPGPIRCRVNIFRQRLGISAAIRLLSESIPELDNLGLPPAVSRLPELNKGLVLVTGETGSGKSTTLAAILNRINKTKPCHIVTMEDPIEYVYEPEKCVISQREVGLHTDSYANALRAVLREDPDVILIGEMRDLDTIETALTAAETGHLVFATLHVGSAAETVDRVVTVFPAERQQQIRLQLSTTLMAVLSQQLLPRKTSGRVCACELMMVNSAIRSLIREGKTPQIESTLSTSADEGSLTMDNCILDLYRKHIISSETAMAAARDPENMRKNTTSGAAGFHVPPPDWGTDDSRRPRI